MSEPPPSYGYQGPPLRPIQSTTPFDSPFDPLISADYNGWWRRNVALVKAYWRPLATLQIIGAVVALVLRIPAAIVQAIQIRGLSTGAPLNNTEVMRALGRALPWLGVGASGSILATLFLALVWLASMRLIVMAVTGGQPTIGDALRGALGRLLPLIGWGLLADLILLAGICACLLPGIYFAAVLTVLPAVVLFERGGVIVRCFKLFHADFGASVARVATVFAVAIAAALVSSVFGAIVTAVARAATTGTGGLVSATLITTVFQVAVTAVIGVLLAPLMLTTYADERARLEPLHTGVLAHELTR